MVFFSFCEKIYLFLGSSWYRIRKWNWKNMTIMRGLPTICRFLKQLLEMWTDSIGSVREFGRFWTLGQRAGRRKAGEREAGGEEEYRLHRVKMLLWCLLNGGTRIWSSSGSYESRGSYLDSIVAFNADVCALGIEITARKKKIDNQSRSRFTSSQRGRRRSFEFNQARW